MTIQRIIFRIMGVSSIIHTTLPVGYILLYLKKKFLLYKVELFALVLVVSPRSHQESLKFKK